MKRFFHPHKTTFAKEGATSLSRGIGLIVFVLLSFTNIYAATKTSNVTSGNWNTAGTWNPSGVPASGDDVVIRSGDVITVDGAFTCNNLTLGNNTNSDATLQITSASNSLTINGALSINPNSKNKVYTLDAGPGTINVAGTIVWGTGPGGGSSPITVSTGIITFTPAVTISSTKQNITFNGAGTVNFNAAFTDQVNKLVTYTGCTVNIKSTYTVNTTAQDWLGKGTAVLYNGSSITPTTAITFNNLQTNTSASATLNSGAGAVIVGGSVTLANLSTFTTNKDFEVGGDWTDNGGTFTGTNDTLTFNSASGSIGGSSSSEFRVLRIGRNAGSTAVSYTANSDVTCNYLRISAGSAARTITVASGKTLTVNNDVLINQPTANSTTASLSVGAGTCNVSGNLTFSGTDNTASRVGQVSVTSGTFTLTGSVTWMSNTTVATSVITVSTGIINFTSSLTMGSASGTLAVTGTGTINFNGTSAPSFTFGGATAPVFTTTNGCTLNFAKGFTNNTNSLALAATSQTNFTGTGTITPSAAITFGHLQISSGTLTLAGNITVSGNWTNNGGTLSGGSYTIIFDGTSCTIGGSSSTTFPTVKIGKASGGVDASYTLNTNSNFSYLELDGNAQARTLTIGSGITLTVTNDATINQPSGTSITNALNINAGTCTVSGNLYFAGNVSLSSKVAKVAVTSGTFTLTGTLNWMSNTISETEVITVSTGTINFGSSITMGSASGNVAVTSTGTINFNGASIPSLSFGGATAPVLTTTSGCTLRFEKGVTTVTTPLTFATGSNMYVGSPTSALNLTVDPGATVTNNGTTVVYGDLTSTAASTFVNGTNANLEIYGAVSSNVTLTASASGNTVKYRGGSAQTVKPATYYNLILDSAGAKSCASGVAVNNNLTVQGAATISNSAAITITGNFVYSSSATSTLGSAITAYGVVLSAGTLNDGGNTITINNAGGWIHNGGTFTTTGTTAFTGSAASSIAGSLPTTFNNFTINNSGGVTLNVSPAAATAIAGALNLTNGVLHTTSSNVIRLLDNATSTSGSSSSYVDGPMVKVGNDDFIFPTGKAGRWMRVAAMGMTTATTEVVAEYFATPYSDTTSLSAELTQVSQVEYWNVNRTGSDDPVKLKLFWNSVNTSSIINCDYLTIAHYHDGQWQKESSTFTGTYCTGESSGSITMDGYVTTFSPFGFGGSGGQALPIKLVSFDAVVKGSIVETSWITELEISNDYFTVERSTDGNNFTEIARVTGAGNSTVMNTYSAIDESPAKGISYYRLRQTDFDAQYTYSNIVAVVVGEQSGYKLFPNPVEGEFYVNVSNPSGDVELNIYDMVGRSLYTRTIQSNGASNQTISVPVSDVLPSGIYLVSVNSNGVTGFKEKVRVL